MNRSLAIREYIAANPDSTCGEIAAALGMKCKQVGVPLHEMARAGILLKDGPGNRYRYRIGRTELQKRHATEEERKAARRESVRKYEMKRTGKPPGERKPVMSREENLARRRERAKKARADERAIKLAKRIVAPPKPTAEFREKLHKSVQAKMNKLRHDPPVVFAKDDRSHEEMMAEFLARGGAIERLPPGAGTSLRFVGVDL